MPRMRILSAAEQARFDHPPVFDSAERKRYFDFPRFVIDVAQGVKIFYGANATIRAFPLSGSHITRFSMCALSFPNRISTRIGKIQATPTLRGANERSRTATYSPNPLLPLDLHYSIRNVHPNPIHGTSKI